MRFRPSRAAVAGTAARFSTGAGAFVGFNLQQDEDSRPLAGDLAASHFVTPHPALSAERAGLCDLDAGDQGREAPSRGPPRAPAPMVGATARFPMSGRMPATSMSTAAGGAPSSANPRSA